MKKMLMMVVFAGVMTGLTRGDDAGSIQDQKRTWDSSYHLTYDDLAFYFDRIWFRDGEWHFKLSTNMRQMTWRISNPDLDISGVCQSGEVLDVALGSSLEITRDDFFLRMRPLGDGTSYQLFYKVQPALGCYDDIRAREAILSSAGNSYELSY